MNSSVSRVSPIIFGKSIFHHESSQNSDSSRLIIPEKKIDLHTKLLTILIQVDRISLKKINFQPKFPNFDTQVN